ncbi:hypothetical protein GOODEAATRI_010851 [Goodea atripinnis]|uniref:AH domain-containing protein n=1 Tax=Goodea atripinnis TaxID=208336 RepID=A0ABV0MR56_9TELE
MLSGGRGLLGEDSSMIARMQKKFWKTKQVLIKATGKKEDEYVVASDADLDAKLEVFAFARFCRMALCPSLHRMYQEVETFRRRAIADTLLTVSRMEKARTEYRGALLWMKDVSQELDPDTYKQLEKFRKAGRVQAQVRETKSQFEKLKNDVCQKVDMLGASRSMHDLRGLSTDSGGDLMLMACDIPPPANVPLQPLVPPPSQDDDQNESCSFGSFQSGLPQQPVSGDSLLSGGLLLPSEPGLTQGEEDGEQSDMAFLKDLLSPGPGGSDEFSSEWQDTFGTFDPPSVPTGAARPPSHPPSPTGFLPSQLLDHSLSSSGQPRGTEVILLHSVTASGGSKDMSAWFNLFADLDPLSNPDAIGRSADELLNA